MFDLGSIPSWIELRTIKFIFTASFRDIQLQKDSMKTLPGVKNDRVRGKLT